MTGPDTAVPEAEHDHTLLESLFYAVFERRFINLKPTGMVSILSLTKAADILQLQSPATLRLISQT
jgi:hypothetical protein